MQLRTALQILNDFSKGDLSPAIINTLVNRCVKIAMVVVNKNYGRTINRNFLSYNDLALDSITSLFIKDSSGELPIRKSLLNWDREIADEISANYFLFKIVSCCVEQEIVNKLKEADPFFGKILRSINNCVETGKCNKASWFGTVYIIPVEHDTITQKPVDAELLENYPTSFFQGNSAKIIFCLFNLIKNETDLFPAIPLNALIKKIKHASGEFLNHSQRISLDEHFEDRLDIAGIATNSAEIVHKKIDEFYLGKGKINSEDAVVLKKVVNDFNVDLQDGGLSRGLYEYLHPYKSELTKDEFYQKYQQPVDYLLRLLKKEIARRLETTHENSQNC